MMQALTESMSKQTIADNAAATAAASASSSSASAASSSSAPSSLGAPDVFLSSLPKSLVDAWLDHCALCFSAKQPYPPPRSYFEQHLTNDPMLDLNGVAIVQAAPIKKAAAETKEEPEEEKAEIELRGRTAEQAAKEEAEVARKKAAAAAAAVATRIIASTARVFVRRMFLGGAEITFGGVGEVCTRPEFRSRGYADLCLKRCQRYLRHLNLQLGALHASGSLASFYAGQGYTSVDRWFGTKSDFEAEKEAGIVGEGRKHGAFSLRLMPPSHFFSAGLLPQFMSMYSSYSRQFNGPLVRNEDYWRNWVQTNIESSIGSSSCYPIEIYAAFEEWDGSDPAPIPASPIRFLSYMFLQRVPCASDSEDNGKRDRVYEIREYAVAPQWAQDRPDGGRLMFLSLVQWAIRQIRHKFIEMDPAAAAAAKLSVRFPLPLALSFSTPLRMDSDPTRDDGFMFQSLPLNMDAAVATAEAAANVRAIGTNVLEESALSSPFAASPFVLHHTSEDMTATSATELFQKLQQDAKAKVVFWKTDSF